MLFIVVAFLSFNLMVDLTRSLATSADLMALVSIVDMRCGSGVISLIFSTFQVTPTLIYEFPLRKYCSGDYHFIIIAEFF